MSIIKLLNNGSWNKPPVLTAARKILMDGLADDGQRTELGNLATFVNGTSYDRGLLAESGTPIIRISNMTDPRSEYLTTNQSFDGKHMVQPGDLLVSWSASFKSVIWPGPVGVLNQHIFKVTEKHGNHRGFIRHAIEAVFDDMQSKVVGIGMMHLRRKDFLGHPVPAPNRETQEAVSRFLDWIEKPNGQPEPTLPAHLSEQRRIVARIEDLAARIEEARGLRRQAMEEAEALRRAMIFGPSQRESRLTKMSELVTLRQPDVSVVPQETYHFAGVYSFGRGVFRGDAKTGMEFRYPRLTRISEGNFIYPKLMAWEGALGSVPKECDGLVVSPEFPVFEVDESKVLPETLDVYFRTASVWPQLSGTSTGTNVRRRRLNPKTFLDYEFPLPSMAAQEQLRVITSKLNRLKRIQTETAAELDALLPSVLDRAFKGRL